MSADVYAAGTVCWRRVRQEDGSVKTMVLLVHRKKQRDVSFPKGKLDPGESLPQAAVRETWEETGIRVALGINLGTVEYQLPAGGNKVVQYWAAEAREAAVRASTFVPNGEIEALEWVSLGRAKKRLSYEADRDILGVFAKLAKRNAIDTFAVMLLRHAKAEPRSADHPVDHLRPLAEAGLSQAEKLVPTLAAFEPERIVSSTAVRCLDTVAPLAKHLGLEVRERDELSQDVWDAGDTAGLRRVVGKAIRRGKTTILCTHRPVLPDAARELSYATSSLPGSYLDEAVALPPGAFSVFHISKQHPGSGILGVEIYPVKL